MKLKTDPRHAARELALSSIFCWLFSEQSDFAALETSKELLELDEEEHELVKDLVSGVKSNIDKIDKIIEDSAPEWPLEKISKVDLVILRVAIYEIIFGKKTPVKVAIDEAVELAKEFGNDTSPKFINGVLGTVADRDSTK
jgi:transcription antitermination protein NusB